MVVGHSSPRGDVKSVDARRLLTGRRRASTNF